MPRTIDFQAVATTLTKAVREERSVPAVLKQRCPAVVRQIQADAAAPGVMRLWGQSINFDELAETQIVDHQIMSAICELAGTSCHDEIVHAGLQHTYGYLFSTIHTPYGYKRDRWVQPHIEAGFGIRRPAIRPMPAEGTLLANLTYMLGRIAFRGERREMAALRRIRSYVSPQILGLDFGRTKATRIVETVRLSASNLLTIRTDLVPYPNRPASSAGCLLVYSVHQSKLADSRLITAFPVSDEIVDELTATDSLGEKVAVRLRFNAHVDGLSRQPMVGQRELWR
jgi:hypothetical protein